MTNDELLRVLEQANKERATKLDLSNKGLTLIPPEIGQLTDLESLILSNNELISLPSEIEKLKNLQVLSLDGNQLAELPLEITKLTRLRELDVSFNRLSRLIPEISQLTSLELLILTGNRLTRLPSRIDELTSLIGLTLDNNLLAELPPVIGQLKKLKYLNLRNNRLTTLPPTIEQLKKLEKLSLDDNPLPVVPPEILEELKSPSQLIHYYLQLQADERKPLNEAKMLLVGEGGVGKTSLMKRLLENSFDPYENKTEGIDINSWGITANGQQIRLNVWDFGGQEIMHATHQFFLTKRSLYLLVIDARQGDRESRLEYWIKLIQSFGGDSPIIVVSNKCDQQSPDVDRRGLKSKYATIKAFVNTSCKTGEGVDQLRQLITDEVGNLKHIHDELPVRWFALKSQLETMEDDYISFNQYIKMCRAEGIADRRSQRILIGFLHDLGIVLNFREDLRLQDTNILNPEWVTKGVYAILNSNALFQNHGVLDREMLLDILDSPAYPVDKHLFIVDMMRKFELCFDFEGFTNERFLIPDLLSREEPDTGEWPPDECLGFQYRYNVLPGSVISRFIVRSHALISKNTYWRNGVVLTNGEGKNRALVKADQEERIVSVYVAGKPQTRREFLAIIRAQFDQIHSTITKLEVKEEVPLPDHPHIVVDYQHLLQLEGMGDPTFVPVGLAEHFNVKDLLDGVEAKRTRRRRLRESGPVEKIGSSPIGSDSRSGSLSPKNNPWRSGAFYLVVFVVILAALGIASIYIPWYAVIIVFLATLLGVSIIGALQLRNDERFEDASFLTLITEFYKSLPLLKVDPLSGTQNRKNR